jgi:predicted  nucleic acid-binding Zn-ribbon protein
MADTIRLESAAARFDMALSRFETVAAKKQGETQRLATLTTEAAALRNDQHRMRSEQQQLVRDLDLVKTKAKELVDTTRQAAGKIDSAMSRIRSVLHTNNPGEGA